MPASGHNVRTRAAGSPDIHFSQETTCMTATAVELVRPSASEAARRILGYDLARSMALLGMMVVHFGLVMAADATQPAWSTMILHGLDGRAAATFVVLAGVGLTLRSRRAVAAEDPRAITPVRATLIRRGLFLLVLGFFNLVIWPGDILRVYGVSLIIAAGLITASDRRLLAAALVFILGFVGLLLKVDYGTNWDWNTLKYHRLWTLKGSVRNLFYDGFRSVFPWTGLLLFGMWLGRRDLRDRAVNMRVVLAAVAAAMLSELVSWWCVSHFRAHPHGMDAETIEALFGTDSMPPLPLFLLSSGGAAVAVIALCVHAAEAWPTAPWLAPLAAMGQMALTWYVLHIILGLGSVLAMGLAASQPLPVGQACGLLFFSAAVLVSWLWKRQFRHGPLEWVMRRVAG
jgi:uncharacterized protein